MSHARSNSSDSNVATLSPLDEFAQILNRLDDRIRKVREVYLASLLPERQPTPASSSSVIGIGARWFGRKQPQSQAPSTPTRKEKEPSTSLQVSPSLTPDHVRSQHHNKEKIADFIPFKIDAQEENDETTVDSMVEDLRRVAEMCIIGENFVTNAENRKLAAFKRQQEKWAKARDAPLLLSSDADDSERHVEETDCILSEEKMQLFDLFFEKNGLEIIVNLLTGKTFQLTDSEKLEIRGDSTSNDVDILGQQSFASTSVSSVSPAQEKTKQTTVQETPKPSESIKNVYDSPDHPCNKTMLPPLSIAIQALQSISILIQNVSRATSLYVILSNNHINELINLPLKMYGVAERRRQINAKEHKIMPSSFASQSMIELSTHFVTFLKSLAMRMNAQTLQFYLTYPTSSIVVRRNSSPKRKAKRNVRRTKSNDDSFASMADKTNVAIRAKTLRSKSGELMPNLSRRRSSSADECDTTSVNEAKARPITRTQSSTSGDMSKDNVRESSVDFEETAGDEAAEFISESEISYKQVQFPLYERALEFCGSHHENFVRLTAMNICLNTLRLTTVGNDADELSGKSTESPEKAISPDGVLHNAEALPFPERLAIAQFTCIPSRVEKLISPIFAKLAERWNTIEDQIRIIDSNKHMGRRDGPGASASLDDTSEARRNEVFNQAKEKVRRQRLIRSFKDKVADLQDDLFMLEDVFKVGLTVLNEQCIEMMLATFVYPLLLQPLLIYHKELTASVDETRFSFTDHPFGGVGVDLSDIDKSLLAVSGPAKAALFTIGCVFQSLTNRPLLSLLFTVLLHPLSPDSTSAPTVRGKLEVATVDSDGRKSIRLDQQDLSNTSYCSTYAFGSTLTNTRLSKQEVEDAEEDEEACVFVLAPALAEVLEFRGADESPILRLRPNPYRRALLKCLRVPDDMSDIRELATSTFDTIVSVFDEKFISGILYGGDKQSMHNLSPDSDPVIDPATKEVGDARSVLVDEVVAALVDCSVFASRAASSEWKLGYDNVGVHALFCAVRQQPRAIATASILIEQRYSKAAALLADQPTNGLVPMGGTVITIPGSPTVNDSDFEERMFDVFVHNVFFESTDLSGRTIAESQLMQVRRQPESQVLETSFSIVIASACTSERLTGRVGTFLLDDPVDDGQLAHPFDRLLSKERRDGACSLLKLDALNALCKHIRSTDGASLQDRPLTGIIFTSDGLAVETKSPCFDRDAVSPLSPEMSTRLFTIGSEPLPMPLASINLSTLEVLPCVCEAPASAAHLFADDVSGVVAEGVTWQSLYIVFVDEFLVFAQPIPGQPGGIGRVISSCGLAHVFAEHDPCPVQQGGPARRLLLSHKWYDKTPPPLFLFDNLPDPVRESHPFVHPKTYTSRLDVWFEHQRAADHAYRKITSQIFQSKVRNGARLLSFLKPT